jgi:HlyD family secretion protein
MPTPKKRKKTIIFSLIALVIGALTIGALVTKREVIITVQTEKVLRRSITETVVANGKIQPVLQVKISPEVSGEIIALPVKEGQDVKKGDLLVKIKPDFYIAQRGQAEASYKSSLAGQSTAEANLRKAEAEYLRNADLFKTKLISDSAFDEARASYDVCKAQVTNSVHQVEMAKANLDSAEDSLSKTTIVSPLNGTISKLNSQLGERVLGTVQNVGTEIMTISDLNEMEARVDIGEIDVVLIAPGQNVKLEVDAFKDKKFPGEVTEIANSSTTAGQPQASASTQEATKFQVKIRVKEKAAFRPGMSVTAEIETRSRTNVLCVPIASVTTRLPKDKSGTNNMASASSTGTNKTASTSASTTASTTSPSTGSGGAPGMEKKAKEGFKPVEVVFLMDGDKAKMVPVKIGISDDSYWEITEGLKEDQDVVSGGYRAISRDLEDGKKIKKGPPAGAMGPEGEKKQ